MKHVKALNTFHPANMLREFDTVEYEKEKNYPLQLRTILVEKFP